MVTSIAIKLSRLLTVIILIMMYYVTHCSVAVSVVPLFEINRILEAGVQSSPLMACFSLSDQVGIDVTVTAITIPETANRMSIH